MTSIFDDMNEIGRLIGRDLDADWKEMDKHANIPDEGERNQNDLIDMLFDYAGQMVQLHFCAFDFNASVHHNIRDAWVSWYIGVANNPEYGCCTDFLYLGDRFDESKCCEWIDAFHTFIFRWKTTGDYR